MGCAEQRRAWGHPDPRAICPLPDRASPSAGQGQCCCSDKVHSLCGDICCGCQGQIANSGPFWVMLGKLHCGILSLAGEHRALP